MADAARPAPDPAASLVEVWRRLGPEQRVAGIGAALFVVSTFGPFSFVEAAMALTGLAVLALLKQRADRKEFHLPGGDGTVILAAGTWAAVLVVARIFDRPLGQSVLALACAAIIAAAGLRERAKRPADDIAPRADADGARWPPGRTRPCASPPTRTPPSASRRTSRRPRARASAPALGSSRRRAGQGRRLRAPAVGSGHLARRARQLAARAPARLHLAIGPGLRIPISPSTPPTATRHAEMTMASWKAATEESARSPYCPATIAPTIAMPSSPATRATALLMPLAMPALLSSTSASTVAVSGATVIDSPTPKITSGGSRSVT